MRPLIRAAVIFLVLASAPVHGQGLPSRLDSVATEVAAGTQHTCALTAAGGVQCWGHNNYGQLGIGSTLSSPVPAAVNGLGSGVTEVATGGHHACALTTAGGVQCWGYNSEGQLGDGTPTNRLVPVAVSGLGSGVAAIAAGENHTCALTTAGGVQCWGDNGWGRLGNGSTASSSVPVAVSGLGSGVAAITAGLYHTCALTMQGGVWCWGRNDAGQLGIDTATNSAVPVALGHLASGVTAITAGQNHACALTTLDAVWCWGSNGSGQLGDGTQTNRAAPVAVGNLGSGATAIAAGAQHTCALTVAGGIRCWGENDGGQLGNGNAPADSAVPVDASGLASGMRAITVGANHACALSATGAIQCWGNNGSGRLGDGTTQQRLVPVSVAGFAAGVKQIAVGWSHTCALTPGGSVWCWGSNGYGQLGTPSNEGGGIPSPVLVNGLASGVQMVATGGNFTCALTAAGVVQCWGANDRGQLGDGTQVGRSAPVAVSGLGSDVAAIAVGARHACALTTAGGLKCWGYNSWGQLGNTTIMDSLTPVAVHGLGDGSGVTAITAGSTHTCAVVAGAARCWGRNYYGQLGDGNGPLGSSVPMQVSGLASGVTAVVAGEDHTCARLATGEARCWGYNFSGQLGNGATGGQTNSGHPTPGPVSNLGNNVAAISAGTKHTCAVTTAGAVYCWGEGGSGRLGNGGTGSSPVPVAVANLASGVAAIAAGTAHTCALSSAGGLSCWGSTGVGQVGNGTWFGGDILTPVSIRSGQSLAFAPGRASVPLNALVAGSPQTLAATATGGGSAPVTFDTWTPDTCTVNGNTVTATAAGLCGLRASRAGGGDGAQGTLADAPPERRLLRVMQLTLATDREPAAVGESVTFTAALSNAIALSGTGVVVFCADATTTNAQCTGGTTLCSGPAQGAPAQCATASLAAGAHTITAWFSGDANNDPALSAPLVQSVGNAPLITSANGVTFTYDSAGEFTFAASGAPAPAFVLDPGDTLPAGVTFADNGGGSAQLAGTPAEAGEWVLHVAAANLVGADTQTFTLTVERAAQAALAASATPAVLIPGMTSQLAASGGSGTGAITYSVDSGACGVSDSTVNAIGAGLCIVRASKAGDDHYLDASATTTITVNVAELPVAQSQAVDVLFNTARTIQLAGEDGNIGGPYPVLAYAIAEGPGHGAISGFDPATGALTYTPAFGYAGTDSFTFTVSTANGTSSPATVTLNVAALPLTLGIDDDGREFARYGQWIDYTVTLTNETGDMAMAVPVTFTLSADFDGDHANLRCFVVSAGALCEPDESNPLRYLVTLPAGGGVFWTAGVAVRGDAQGDNVELAVAALGTQVASDTNTLVVFKDGFDALYGDGTKPLPGIDRETGIANGESGDSRLHDVSAVQGSTPTTLARVHDGAREARIEACRIDGAVYARWFERDERGQERATEWIETEAGTTLESLVAFFGGQEERK